MVNQGGISSHTTTIRASVEPRLHPGEMLRAFTLVKRRSYFPWWAGLFASAVYWGNWLTLPEDPSMTRIWIVAALVFGSLALGCIKYLLAGKTQFESQHGKSLFVLAQTDQRIVTFELQASKEMTAGALIANLPLANCALEADDKTVRVSLGEETTSLKISMKSIGDREHLGSESQVVSPV